MLGTLIVTHGNVAESLMNTVLKIMGPSDQIDFFCLDWDDDMNQAKSQLKLKIQAMDQGSGVLILTDMFGGTPTNISLAFHEEGRVEIITGVNLPMIMKTLTLPADIQIGDAAEQIKTQAQKSIYLASELL